MIEISYNCHSYCCILRAVGETASVITASADLSTTIDIIMSISHLVTGAALAAGTLLLCLWLVALAAGFLVRNGGNAN